MHNKTDIGALVTLLSLIVLLSLPGWPCAAAEDPIVTIKVEGKFAEVLRNVRMAIIGKGIHIAHVLPASAMLNRTGPAFGYRTPVYADAETLEFCSARISHLLAREDPDNIVLCPFTISVYVLTAEPNQVRISYRIPTGKPGSEEAVGEVVSLIKSILEDATW